VYYKLHRRRLILSLYAFLFSSITATDPACLNLPHLTMLPVFREEYKPWSPSLYNFLQPPTTSSLRPKYLPQHPIFKHSLRATRDEVSRSSSSSNSNNNNNNNNNNRQSIVLCTLIFVFLYSIGMKHVPGPICNS